MNLSTQLRIILLLVGAAIWLAIYLYGKRKAVTNAPPAAPLAVDAPQVRNTPGFAPAEDLEDEFETPAYMRRQGQREPRQDYEPRIADASDYSDLDEVRDEDRQYVDDKLDRPQVHATDDLDSDADQQHEPIYARSRIDESVYTQATYDSAPDASMGEPEAITSFGRREPIVTLDEFEVADKPVASYAEPQPPVQDEPVHAIAAEPPTLPNIPVVEHPVAAAPGYSRRTESLTNTGLTAAPTLSEAVPAERVAARTPPASSPSAAPANGASKASGNAARRKIIALRIPMPERVPGVQLLSLLQGERLQHGKFSIFHRMQDTGTVFSVASMVEPGTFDPQAMLEQQFPGVTLFMLLPGPVDGLVAYDQMLSCAQRIAHATGGVLQDERGSKLTPQTVEKLRDEVLDFQHLIGGMAPAT